MPCLEKLKVLCGVISCLEVDSDLPCSPFRSKQIFAKAHVGLRVDNEKCRWDEVRDDSYGS